MTESPGYRWLTGPHALILYFGSLGKKLKIKNWDLFSITERSENYEQSLPSFSYLKQVCEFARAITSERPTSTSSPECHRSPIDFSSPLRNVPPSPQLTTWNFLFCKGVLCSSLPRTSTSLTALNDTSLISFVLAKKSYCCLKRG